jgi:hypothetical protein
LFEEFYRQGVLSSEFFLNDRRLLGGIEGKPDQDLAMKFNDANRRARDIALQQLKIDSQDVRALYSLTLATGMQADYLGILERRHLDSLRLIKGKATRRGCSSCSPTPKMPRWRWARRTTSLAACRRTRGSF